MKIAKYPQSAFLIEDKGKKILIDPGKYCYDDNFKPENWKDIDFLLLTHGHSDHCFLEAVEIIYEKNKPVIIGSKWVNEILSEKNIPIKVFEPGNKEDFDGISITAVNAKHGEHPQMKKSPKEVIGFLIEGMEKSVYHCADTLYIKDRPYADIVLVPISNDWVTMDPKEAAIFVKEINPKLAIPIHYESPKHPMDPNKFLDEMKDSDIKTQILENGKSLEV